MLNVNVAEDRPNLKAMLDSYERQLIETALAATKGNQRRAAATLGLLPTTLHEKMKRLGLIRPRTDQDHGELVAGLSTASNAKPVPFGAWYGPRVPILIANRLAQLPWAAIEQDLDEHGWARTPVVLTAAECRGLIALYDDDRRFRSRVDMARHRFGQGDYKYFQRPLPPLVEELREHAYPYLSAVANRWMTSLGAAERYPRSSRPSWPAAPGRARPSRRPCSSTTRRAATTACTRTSTEKWPSPSSSRRS